MYGLQIPALWWGELQAIRRADVTFVCSDGDQRYLADQWKLSGIEVVPNTVPIPEPQSIVTEPTLLLLASFQYEPNFQAADFLIEEIWPHIYQARPDAKLLIAGREPQKIRSYSKNPTGVEFTGFVENLDLLYRRSRVVCCPILSGGGTRIKMLEAAAYSKPIVATAIGAEGLMMSDGQEFLKRNNPREFAQACLELLNNDLYCENLGKSAREAAIKYYDRSRILKKIQQYVLDA
jgi:hypothetical protein